MKRHFDFTIEENEPYHKTILRFYPKQSHVHGFDDSSPNSWNKVYKTYMSFSILRYYKNDKTVKYDSPDTLYCEDWDEGEGLRSLRNALSDIVKSMSEGNYNIIPFGNGTDWEIESNFKDNNYKFTMINDFTGQAYRFNLSFIQIKDLYNVLNNFLEYMLKHSQGI